MNKKWQAELTQTAARTFEQLCFMIPDPDREPRPQPESACMAMGVHYQGPFSGTFVLKAHRDALPPIAANMLGEEDLPPDGKLADALGELANVICGNVLPKFGEADAVFHLGAPTPVDPSWLPDGGGDCVESRLVFEEGQVDIFLLTDRDGDDEA